MGVQCNGQGSSGAMSGSSAVQPNTEYDLTFIYDGLEATIYVNGALEVGPTAKSFNFFTEVVDITIGSGSHAGSSEDFDFGTISDITVDDVAEMWPVIEGGTCVGARNSCTWLPHWCTGQCLMLLCCRKSVCVHQRCWYHWSLLP